MNGDADSDPAPAPSVVRQPGVDTRSLVKILLTRPQIRMYPPMQIPRFVLCFPVLLLLAPLTRWLRYQHDPHFFLGLSSNFWTGVSIGMTIVFGAAFVALAVLHVSARQASGDGE